ncbi:MAG: RHS repeat-associated core domain-containing protein [Nitrospirota bacterium]
MRDINFNAIQERDGNNNVTRSYVWDEVSPGGIGGLLELTQAGAHYNYLYDGKGNVSAVIDSNQNVVASYKYDGFGKLISKSGTLDQPYMFSTKPYYEGYGKSYYGYRFYDPISGKWMARDPLGEKTDINLYRGMGNNLINILDLLGLCAHYADTGYFSYEDPQINQELQQDIKNYINQSSPSTPEEEALKQNLKLLWENWGSPWVDKLKIIFEELSIGAQEAGAHE